MSGLIIHESRWQECFNVAKQLRVTLKDEYGIARNAELHANKNVAGRGAMWGKRWTTEERVRLFKLVLEAVSQLPAAKTFSICVVKSATDFTGAKGRTIHDTAWTFLLQRFHNYISGQRGGATGDHGLVIHDTGHDAEIRKLLRKLRVYNYVPSYFGASRNVPLSSLVEDPFPRDSAHSQFVQLVDYVAYSVLRRKSPAEKYPGLEDVYEILRPVILEEASSENRMGLVHYPKGSA